MSREELRKLIVGPVATVPTPFDDDFEVDYGRMHELTQYWVEGGLVKGKAVIKVAAAMGEGPMLRDDEWPYLVRTVVNAAKDKAFVMCGLHYKDTLRIVEDAKRAQDMGARALQISPPIFNLPSQQDILDHYEAISDAIDIGIMVYFTQGMAGGHIKTETILKMADFENVVSVKWGRQPEGLNKHEDMTKFAHIFNVIDNGVGPVKTSRMGATGYINLTSDSYPPHDLKVWKLIENGQYDEAERLHNSVNEPLRAFYTKVSQRTGGQAVLKKGITAIMGQPAGASRPPSKPLTSNEMEELRQILFGFGWPVIGESAANSAAS